MKFYKACLTSITKAYIASLRLSRFIMPVNVLTPIPFSLLYEPMQQCKIPCPAVPFSFLISKTRLSSDNTIGYMEEEVDMVGRSSVDHYLCYLNRSELVSLYQSTCMLAFVGQKIRGVSHISAFDQCWEVISTVDSQPSAFCGGILVLLAAASNCLERSIP